MNNKGQVWAYSLMLGITVIVLALALSPAGNEAVQSAMNSSTADLVGLDCNNSSISTFNKGACVVTDYSIPYFFGGLILIGVTIVGARLLFS